MKNEIIICRCEDVTREDIHRALGNGHRTLEELKRYLRIGMGPCQGRTCVPLVRQILADYTGMRLGEISSLTTRPPLIPIPIHVLAAGEQLSRDVQRQVELGHSRTES